MNLHRCAAIILVTALAVSPVMAQETAQPELFASIVLYNTEFNGGLSLKADPTTGRVGPDFSGPPKPVTLKIYGKYLTGGKTNIIDQKIEGTVQLHKGVPTVFAKEITYSATAVQDLPARPNPKKGKKPVGEQPKWRTTQVAPYLYHSVSANGMPQPVLIMKMDENMQNMYLDNYPLFKSVTHQFEGVKEFVWFVRVDDNKKITGKIVSARATGSLSLNAVTLDDNGIIVGQSAVTVW